ncbi:MAG: replication protein [Nautiliaceae bacterium]
MNFFQMPNFLWDRDDLDIYERVILTHIVRKTIGWGKSTDGISYSQFQKALGISRPKIVATIKKLEEKKIIQVIRQTTPQGHSINLYKIHDEIIEKANEEVINDINKGSKSDLLGVVNDINKQNASNTKYTITKDNNKNINIYSTLKDFLADSRDIPKILCLRYYSKKFSFINSKSKFHNEHLV